MDIATLVRRLALLCLSLGSTLTGCTTQSTATVPLGGACTSVSECDDHGATMLVWCCDTAVDGRAHVCRSTNCFGIK